MPDDYLDLGFEPNKHSDLGFTPSAPAAGKTPKPPSAASRFGKGLYDASVGGVVNLGKTIADAAKAPAQAASDKLSQGDVRGAVAPAAQALGAGIPGERAVRTAAALGGYNDFQEMSDKVAAGNFRGALFPELKSMMPVPMRMMYNAVEPIVSDVAKGDYAGAAGRVVGEAGMMFGPGLVSKGLKATARAGAETAMHTGKLHRLTEANPGKAIIEESNSFKPTSIARDLRTRGRELTQQTDAVAAGSPNTGSLQEGLDPVLRRQAEARSAGATHLVDELEPMREYFQGPAPPGFGGTTFGTPPSIFPDQSATQLLKMRRKFNPNFGISYHPASPGAASPTVMDAGKEAYGGLTSAAKKAAKRSPSDPGIDILDERVHDIIPAQQAAESTSRNAGFLQRGIGRVAAHSGALLGGIAGYQHGGIPGAVAGWAIPELIASPTAQMIASRGINVGGRLAGWGPAQAVSASIPGLPPEEDIMELPDTDFSVLTRKKRGTPPPRP